jgi:Ca-activated chloride channel family protein
MFILTKNQILTTAYLLITATAAFTDGLIIVPPSPGQPGPANPYPLQVNYHHVETVIDNMIAVTSVDQEFYNPTAQRLEGYYLFPIPENAIIGKFNMYIDGKETEAELLDAAKARQVYEEIVRKLIDPALLEYYGKGMFKARIFPLDPHSVKRVKISYRETLEKNNGTVGYTYPLNTEKFSSAPVKDVTIKVSLTTSGRLKNAYCPSHETEIIRKSSHEAAIGYESHNTTPDKDFSFYYTTDSSKFGISLLTQRESGNDGYFFLNISPDYDIEKNDIEEKDITFILDVSGSMAGKKLEQAKAALHFCVANLNTEDRFEIVRFSTEAEALFGKLTTADSIERNKAYKFISDLRAIGGTNIEEALRLAFAVKTNSNRPYMIIFITDGKPTIGKTGEDELVAMLQTANSAKTRVFTFGIGDEINTHLLDKLTDITSAYRTYVTPDEDIEVKVSDLYTKVQSPLFTDLSIDFGNQIDARLLYPKTLPDLFRGSTITLLGRYRGHGLTDITLKGRVHGQKKEIVYKAEFPESKNNNLFISALWAARRIGFLLDQIRLNGTDKELVDEVTSLAKTYGIVTPYTSFLIVEDDDLMVQQKRIREEDRSLSSTLRGSGSGFVEEKKQDFEAMKSKSGAPSTRASSEVQALTNSANTDQIKENQKRLNYKSKDGVTRNITQQVKFIQGRAFYNNGTNWMDIEVQKQSEQIKKHRIKYGNSEYFDLLKQHPVVSQYFALGKNVAFVMKGEIYEISE